MKFRESFKYFVLFSLLVSMGFLFGFTKHRNDLKIITDVHIEFDKNEALFLSNSMVNKLLIQNQNSVQNQAKSKLDLYRLEQQVQTNPYVEKVSVFTTINGELFAAIKERTPIARVLTDKDSYYLDKKGVRIPLSKKYSARVPIIKGFSSKKDMDAVVSFLSFIREDNFLNKEITGVEKLKSEEVILTVRSGDYKISFGKIENIEHKFMKLKAFYTKTIRDQSISKYKTINLKFHNQVVGIK